MMRICFIADTGSPTTRSFVSLVAETHDVFVIDLKHPGVIVRSSEVVPRDAAPASQVSRSTFRSGIARRLLSAAPHVVTRGVDTYMSARVPRLADVTRAALRSIAPDVVHALRIPFEGIVAAGACGGWKLVLSVWGNDFTLHAATVRAVRRLTRVALSRADALMADCDRDLLLASRYGFDEAKPKLRIAGSGGVDARMFFPAEQPLPSAAPIIVNPRGVRAYVRTENFIAAMPHVIAKHPDARFKAVGLVGHPEFSRLASRLGVSAHLDLLPRLTAPAMAELYRSATVCVSPSEHDGTPNTLIEAMACGSVPIAGDVDSIREWITHDDNGLLCDPRSPVGIAAAINSAIERPAWRASARATNFRLVAHRADRVQNQILVRSFYDDLFRDARRRGMTSAMASVP